MEALIPLTVSEVRRLLWWLVWGRMPMPEHVINWSRRRRKHQAEAKRCHYIRREQMYLQL